jgi:translocation and assembly module TamB
VVADTVVIRGGQFLLTLPWHPADSLRGAARDSAVRFALGQRARGGPEIRRAGRYFTRTYRWTGLDLVAPYVRLADPDSVGRRFAVARLDADENDPPFRWRNLRGDVRQLGDTVWAEFAHWDLPGSTGRGRAKVVWGSGLPVRYAVHVDGDSVSLADVAWVYPTLPRSGGGRMALDIRNSRGNLRVLEYALSGMDVRTTRSRLTGAMTFAVGGPVLQVKDVALRARPVDFDLLRALAGGPFAYDFQGTLTGTVYGPGGRLDRFRVDSADVTFADRHVPGAVSRVRGRGGLDVLRPAFTKFRGFAVDAERVDLRTIRHLNREFPALGGVVRGRAVLDSSYLDVRARDGLFTHVDGPAAPTTVAAAARHVRRADDHVRPAPRGAAAVVHHARALVPGAPGARHLRRPAPPRRRHRRPRRRRAARRRRRRDGLRRAVNARGPVYAARGTWALERASPRALAADPALPDGRVNATGAVDLRLSGVADAEGSLTADVARSTLAGGRIYGGALRARAGGGRLAVDSLFVEGAAGRLRVAGALGLVAGRSDTLRVEARVDSLGGLRGWIAARAAAAAAAADTAPAPGDDPVARVVAGTVRQPVAQTLAQSLARAAADTGAAADPAAAAAAAPPDSLAGELRVGVTLTGSVDTSRASPGLAAAATLAGRGLVYGRLGAEALDLSATAADLLRAPALAVTLGADSLVLGGLALARADGTFGGSGAGGRFAVRAGSPAGALISGGGRTASEPGRTDVMLDSLRVVPRPGRAWTLAGPARLTAAAAGNALSLDSLVLRGADGSRIALGGALADRGPVAGSLAVSRASLADLGAVLGGTGLAPLLAPPAAGAGAAPAAPADSAAERLDGLLTATVALAGTRARPTLDASVDATAVRVAGARVDRVSGVARYADRRLAAEVGVLQGGARVLDARATLPVDLALVPVADRLGADTVRASLRADSLDAALLAAAAAGVRDVRGRVAAALDLSGTWRRPRLDGRFALAGGSARADAAGIRVEDAAAEVALAGDSVAVRRLFARSGGAGDTVAVTGWLRLTEPSDPQLALQVAARNFLAVDRPRLATVWVSTPEPLVISGRYRAASVRGAVRAERGRIYIPELIDKRVVDLSEYIDVVDTTVFTNRRLLPGAPAAFVENLALAGVRLSVGDDVWLRSPETNIKLGGSLAVTRAVTREAAGRPSAQLALLGALNVERGTYRLDLLPLAQPTFDVQPGTLRFFGTPDLNPTLDIRAVHVVRQNRPGTNRPDVRVRVAIAGTLERPTLQLSSGDTPPIPDTDLISYLVTGEPAASIFGQAQGSDQLAAATSIISRLAGSLVSGALSRGGGPFDVVQVETGARSSTDPAAARATSAFSNILGSTRLGVGGRLGPRTFYTFSTGFCSFTGNTDPGLSVFSNFTRGLGVRLEQRVTPSFSVQLGVEPALQQQACLASAATRFFQQTPSQGSIDFTKQWSF